MKNFRLAKVATTLLIFLYSIGFYITPNDLKVGEKLKGGGYKAYPTQIADNTIIQRTGTTEHQETQQENYLMEQ